MVVYSWWRGLSGGDGATVVAVVQGEVELKWTPDDAGERE